MRRLFLGLLSVWALVCGAWAADPPTPEQAARLKRAGELNAQVVQLYGEGRYSEAVVLAREAATIRGEVLGEQHPDYAVTLNNLAAVLETLGRYDESIPLHQKALAIYAATAGKESEGYATSLNNLAKAYVSTGDYAAGAARHREAAAINKAVHGAESADYALSLNNLADTLTSLAKYDEAEELLKESININIQVYGEQHPMVALGLSNLAYVYERVGNLEAAEAFYTYALQIRGEVQRKDHPEYATTLYNLASVYGKLGRFDEAEAMMKQALAIRQEVFGPSHPQVANSLGNLANLYLDMGRTEDALELNKVVMAMREETLGTEHPMYAQSLDSVAGCYRRLGRLTDAERLAVQAAQIRRATLGEAHPDFAASLESLALLYESMGREDAAIGMHRDALAIYEATLGPDHMTTAATRKNLGSFCLFYGRPDLAKGYLMQAADSVEKTLGREHPGFADFATDLAEYHRAVGEYETAESLFLEALALNETHKGKDHEATLTVLDNMSRLYQIQGLPEKAEQTAREALDRAEVRVEQAARGQTPEAALAYLSANRYHLWTWLRCAREGTADPRAISDRLLRWKGMVSTQQLQLRQTQSAIAANGDPRAAELFTEMATVSERLSASILRTDPADDAAARDATIRQLSERLESIQRELIDILKAELPDAPAACPTTADIQRLLPAGTALVNYDYVLLRVPTDDPAVQRGYVPELLLIAAIITADDVAVIEVGKMEEVEDEIDRFRRTVLSRQHQNPWAHATHPAAVVRRRMWEPLLPHLGDSTTILISPAGPVGRLPWVALPGAEDGRYLLEEDRLIVSFPYPRLLAQLLETKPLATADGKLLLVGDVDYEGVGPARDELLADARGDTSRGGMTGWTALAGTGPEAIAIGDLYRHVATDREPVYLHARGATEEAVRDELSQATYAHIATHGYFAAASMRSLLAAPALGGLAQENIIRDVGGYNPGVLSGIVLSGVNAPTAGAANGILTALEVEGLDLSGCRLAVLSACETGLGTTAGGTGVGSEGVLGLQRSFQIAGAGATITSLWQVDDAATKVLMVDVYKGLWEAKLGGAEALRAAQRAVLQNPELAGVDARGFSADSEADADLVTSPDSVAGKAPPYYWAAFIYAGDWR